MKIQDRRKDYYDWVAWQYGGGDPRLVYLRGSKIDLNQQVGVKLNKSSNIQYCLAGKIPHLSNELEAKYNLKWCVVCGVGYLIVHNKQTQTATFLEPGTDIYEYLDRHFFSFDKHKTLKEEYFGVAHESLKILSKIIKQPVFMIKDVCFPTGWKDYRLVLLEPEIPMLKDLGFTKIIEPEQMYQQISMFYADITDTTPPNYKTVDDKNRLVQRGFDPKTSFRGKP